jgi:hypothetical protein
LYDLFELFGLFFYKYYSFIIHLFIYLFDGKFVFSHLFIWWKVCFYNIVYCNIMALLWFMESGFIVLWGLIRFILCFVENYVNFKAISTVVLISNHQNILCTFLHHPTIFIILHYFLIFSNVPFFAITIA